MTTWNIADVVRQAGEVAKASGWHDKPYNVGEQLMLIVTEVAEAMEDVRVASDTYKLDKLYFEHPVGSDVELSDTGFEFPDAQGNIRYFKPVGFPSELADIVIRVAHLAYRMGIDLNDAVHKKMLYNATRTHRHGGKNV